jgi:Rps23 Pro-64 3,4-dihydroxylase Tpa1-like proline 4-hydroxylase
MFRDIPDLTTEWRDARPFPHVVIDDFVAEPDALLAILDDEPVERYEADIFAFEATAPEPETEAFRALREAFARAVCPALSRITGKPVSRTDLRAYAYRPGHYLLPHTDHQVGLARVLAVAYYLPSPEPPIGGELELFACTIETGELTSTVSAKVIEPRANRLVVFDVGDATLHQVREVLAGLRLSLAGWLYA